ncbi:GFA family protein [Frigidibacter oleivorans]
MTINAEEKPSNKAAVEGRCDCGEVSVTIPDLPADMNACPCDFCSRFGALWGYFPHGSAVVAGDTTPYRRASRMIEFHRCVRCGVVTHWIDPDGHLPHMGVNMRNFDSDVIGAVPVVVEP